MKKPKLVDEAMVLNNRTYIDYFNRLKMLAISIFEWEGLDEIGGNSRFLEMTLFEEGKAVFVNDKELGYLTLRVAPNGKLNYYNLPVSIEAVSIEYNKKYPMKDVVYIMNNELQLPTSNTIELFARRLYEIERTTEINIKAQKTPVLIAGNERQRLTLQNLYMQYDGNVPFIFGDSDANLENGVKAISTLAPFVADKLTIQKHEVWNDCLTYLGINNANTDKKERLITDEVQSNNELIYFYLNCFYKTRKRACEEINKKFFNGEEKVKIKVNKNLSELLGVTEEELFDDPEEGDDNE
jgi:hypothetical protein